MNAFSLRPAGPELKQVVREASRALALLDVDRLEDLARACRALRCLPAGLPDTHHEAREALQDMAVFARVLEATRGNLEVMHRLKALREGHVSYAASRPALAAGGCDGND